MPPIQDSSSSSTPEMEARAFPLSSASPGAQDGSALPPAQLDRSRHPCKVLTPVAEAPSSCRGMERVSLSNLRNAFRPGATLQHTVRVVTPEPGDLPRDKHFLGEGTGIPTALIASAPSHGSSEAMSSVATGGLSTNRRQGMVFNDSFSGSYDTASPSPPPSSRLPPGRPRTHTVDGALRQQLSPSAESRHRVGSFSSSGSLPLGEDVRASPFSQIELYRVPDIHIPSPGPTSAPISALASKDRKGSGAATSRRLVKRASSRPTSPLISPPPSVDSLPMPIPTDDANKVLLLMKTLCGRMRGEVEYQTDGPWYGGICYIEEEKGSLMFDSGENGPFHIPVVPDLRGCRVFPVEKSLAITSPQLSSEVILRPLIAEELDLWLAALLCWQQLRATAGRQGEARISCPPPRADLRQRASASGLKETTIIKVGKVMLWDKGLATSPRAIVKRPSTRDLRSPYTSWRRVSCILRDNGEFKLMTENDVAVISIIELSQLSRAAIQQLDKSVLDEDYCIAIFPIYSTTSTQLSIFRPVYLALDSRVLFEVWFVLLRAFTAPEVYSTDPSSSDQAYELIDANSKPVGEIFRVEKTISVRITEAKIRNRTPRLDAALQERPVRNDHDWLVGNYFAEVILDGEVRARTTTKMDTKAPFWREDCEFTELPATHCFLSVILKRVEGNLDSLDHQVQASLGLSKTGNLIEVVCGAVDIPLHQMERGKDHEQWLQINDERQQAVGTMLVKIHHEELVVLFSHEYQPLSELLHRFDTGLTGQICEAIPGNLRRLAEIFLNIFQVSSSATEWIMNIVEDEVHSGSGTGNFASAKPRFSRRFRSNDSLDSASDRDQIVRDMGKSLQGEANLLFRGNSLLTQALELHMRRLGREYLEDVLSKKIFEINEINPNCEVDPAKLPAGEDLQQHWTQLIHLTTELWECIKPSAGRLPPELRHILKHIRGVTEDRYGDFLRTVTYTSVSGFLFLRFICPAILNPKLFGLLRDHPRPRAQRTLTLMAKGLQALANLSNIGKKETWMEPMNRFLNTQRQSLKDFLDQVCAIPMERTNGVLPASYSTPITILGRLSPIAREGFPSLPYLIDHARNFAALTKLWTDSNAAPGFESRVYEGDLSTFHILCGGLQQRANDCVARIESLRVAETSSQLAEDYLILSDAMDYVSLRETPIAPSSHVSSTVWVDQDVRPVGWSGSEMNASSVSKDNLFGGRDLSTLRQVSESSEVSGGGTMRGLRNGKHARKFLSGFMRKRNASPVPLISSPAPGPVGSGRDAGRDRDGGREGDADQNGREKDIRERGGDRDRGRDQERVTHTVLGLEPRQESAFQRGQHQEQWQ